MASTTLENLEEEAEEVRLKEIHPFLVERSFEDTVLATLSELRHDMQSISGRVNSLETKHYHSSKTKAGGGHITNPGSETLSR